MCSATFVSARLKIDRAIRHVNELQHVLAAFLKTDFYRIWFDTDTEPGAYLLRYEAKPLPPEVPLIIGDAIHNLSVAMDHIASQIARDLGKDGDRVHFPKDEARDRVAKSSRLALIVEAAPGLKDVILDQICPYKGGRYALWEIGKLDNVDKHKLLVPTLSVTQLSGICAIDDNRNQLINLTASVGAGGRLNVAGFYTRAKITNHGKPAFKVSFAKNSYFDGQPVIPTLIQLVQFTREAVSLLERGYSEARAA